jgi:CRISPR-associated protein Cmr4
MYFHIFKIKCLTNLHVGSGDINYSVVDKEVEKDPVTGLPIIHASGIKGAFLKHFKDKMSKADIENIFGAPGNEDFSKPGSYRFLDAHLLARPMRTEEGDAPFINVTTVEIMKDFLNTVENFSGKSLGKSIPSLDFGNSKFLATEKVCVEGAPTERLGQKIDLINALIGDNYAIAQNMRDYDLPIIARNFMNNGISQNLWYEEFVPYNSVFFMVILTPEEECKLDFTTPIQIGGNASVGYGFTKIDKIDLSKL